MARQKVNKKVAEAPVEQADAGGMRGPRKVATFLLSLNADLAAQVMKNMDEEDVAAISEEMAHMQDVTNEEIDLVFKEYSEAGSMIQIEPLLHKILEKTLGAERARELIERIRRRSREREPFQVLRHLEPGALQQILKGEHPQVLALVISHLESQPGLEVLRAMTEDLRYDVVKRMATTSDMPFDMVRQVDDILSERAVEATELGARSAGRNRYKNIAEMLNMAEPTIAKTILDRLGKDNPNVAAEIQSMMFVFEDLTKVADKDMQKILSSIEKDLLPLALKTASGDLSEKLLGNLSKRARQTLEDEIEILGPKPLSEVEEAQKSIVEIVRKMAEDGEITIQRGNAEELV
ncbi:MAG: flagellar motor switch protein FliG [Planctomycetota bacterium]|jgi:flagellar motor switch protein FliG|nr:flagellar motor switch protein FliG [Planctomycetota bacterium]